MTERFEWLPGWDEPLLESRPYRVIGIDLGTTNSTVTEIVWDPESDQAPVASLIDIPQLTTTGEIVRDLVPSVVALRNGQEFIGVGAHRLRSSAEVQLVRNRDVWSETKNDIGTRRVYPGAPEGYRNPREIAGHVLRFLHEAAVDASDLPIDKVVITVPASFQLTQRQDTIDAASSAGIELAGQDLFDEPVAAFLDYLVNSGAELLTAKQRSRVMVVDFGGGTCDVALLEVGSQDGGTVSLARKGVSRFHRIGGSDIDAVIAHEVLLPQLMEQNGIPKFGLNYKQKRDYVIPALSALAEQLKKKLSDLAHQRIQTGVFDPKDSSLQVTLPMPVPVVTGNVDVGTVSLAQPRLTLGQWRSATRRFLSQNLMAPIEREHFQAASIFAPINDCLGRADWTPLHLDHILLVGGASLDYAVREALGKYFSDATILTYGDPLDAQRCVGRGAAFQALLLAAFGTSPLVPTIADAVSVQTNAGPHVVVPAESTLPYPATDDEDVHLDDGVAWKNVSGLAMSEGADEGSVDLRIAFLTGDRPLYTKVCAVRGPVAKGAPLSLFVRIDDNQRMQARVEVETETGRQLFDQIELDNPFSVTANPNADRDRILELEDQIAAGGPQARQKLFELATLHYGLREYERARQLMEQLLQTAHAGEANRLLFHLALVCGDMNDHEAQIEFYRDLIERTGDPTAAFNLALHLETEDPEGALPLVDRAVADKNNGPSHSLRGNVLSNLGREDEARSAWQEAIDRMPDLAKLSEFELAWLANAAERLGDSNLAEAARTERKSRKQSAGSSNPVDDLGALPDRVV